jgi:hypothetical protein
MAGFVVLFSRLLPLSSICVSVCVFPRRFLAHALLYYNTPSAAIARVPTTLRFLLFSQSRRNIIHNVSCISDELEWHGWRGMALWLRFLRDVVAGWFMTRHGVYFQPAVYLSFFLCIVFVMLYHGFLILGWL